MEQYIILIAVPLVLAAFLAFGLSMYISQRKIRKHGTHTLAKVVQIDTIKSQQDVSYKLTVEFTNQRGKTIIHQIASTVSNPPEQKVPFQIPIIYLENKGKLEVIIGNNKTLSIIGISVSLFSILMLILYAFYIFNLI